MWEIRANIPSLKAYFLYFSMIKSLCYKKHIIGAVSLPIICIICPKALSKGTKAQAIWSISIAKIAIILRWYAEKFKTFGFKIGFFCSIY